MKNSTSATPLSTHIGLVLLVDFKNTNPQGDPDNDNAPRTDFETGHGLITACGPKRKIRDYLALNGHQVYVARGACFQTTNRAIADKLKIGDIFGADPDDDGEEDEDEKKAKTTKGTKKGPKATPENAEQVRRELCSTYIDARWFGQLVPQLPGVLRGPVQFSMGESVSPVHIQRMAITRVAVATEKEAESQGGANRGMGGLWYIPYGLYRFHIYLNPSDAKVTGFTEADYELLLKAIGAMFDNDRSTTRNSSCVRGLYEFRMKPTMRGAVNMERELERILVTEQHKPARSFRHYSVNIDPRVFQSNDYTFRAVIEDQPGAASEAAE